jgi:spermidine synthase
MDSVNTTIPTATTTTLLLGAATVIAQSILLRESMAAMGGSEIAWGLVMALWLAGMSLGARLGVRIGSPRFASAVPVITLVLSAAGTLLFRAAPAILGATAGESITTWYAVWLWALAILPAACAGGVAFPILAGALGETGAGRAYVIEAVGALVGGLVLSFVLIRFGSAAALLVAIGGIAGIQIWSHQRVVALLLLATCGALASPAGDRLADATWRWSGHPGVLGAWAETRQQRLEASDGLPTVLYADGRLLASYPDPYSVLPQAHLMMLLHPDPRRVFAVGCAANGSVEAMIRHQPDEILIVEDDPHLMPLLEKWYGNGFGRILDHPTIRLAGTGPLRAIETARDLDLIILADGDPTTLRANRTRTTDFFRRCRRALGPSGVLILRVGVPDTYLGGTAGELLTTLTSTLREVFPTIVAAPGERILLVAGGPDAHVSMNVDELARRLARREGAAEFLPAAMLPLLADPTRQEDLAAFVDAADSPPNTILRPHAVGLAANLHEARSRPSPVRFLGDLGLRGPRTLIWVLIGAVTCLLATAVGPKRRIRIVATAWVVGATSMGWWLLLLAAWQATRGAIYAEIGALTGLTMAGIAIGGRLGLRIERPARALPLVLGGGVVVSLLIAAGSPLWAPGVLVPSFLTLGGLLTGVAFPILGALAGDGSARRGAGIAFSADEIGAAVAALIIGTAAIPWVGMTWSAVGLALLGLAAIPAALRA